MTKKRFVMLVNPHGGTRQAVAILEEVLPEFVAADAELEVRHTDLPGHATILARTLDLGTSAEFGWTPLASSSIAPGGAAQLA